VTALPKICAEPCWIYWAYPFCVGFLAACPGHSYRRRDIIAALAECGIRQGLQEAVVSALVGAREVPSTRLADVMSRAGLSVVEAARVEDHLVGHDACQSVHLLDSTQ
jgi:hypothetical protein